MYNSKKAIKIIKNSSMSRGLIITYMNKQVTNKKEEDIYKFININ